MEHRKGGLGDRGKKRKLSVIDADAERNLYSSFVSAANTVSGLYTHAVQQQRRSAATASKQTLERILHFLLREYGSSDAIPKAALLAFLQQEYEGMEGCENAPHEFPVHLFPVVQAPNATEDPATAAAATAEMKPARGAQSGVVPSPARRSYHSTAHGTGAAMETIDMDP